MSKSRERRTLDRAYQRRRELKDALNRRKNNGREVSETEFNDIESSAENFMARVKDRNKRKGVVHDLNQNA